MSNSATAKERRRKRSHMSKSERAHKERSKSFMDSRQKVSNRQHTKDVALADAIGLTAEPISPARRAFQDV